MPGGRPPLGSKHVERTRGSEQAKLRLSVILQTLSGERTIESACEALGVGEAMFHKLRKRFLQESVESLEPRPSGTRPRYTPQIASELQARQSQIETLEAELKRMRVREEVALVTTHAVRNEKKKGR